MREADLRPCLKEAAGGRIGVCARVMMRVAVKYDWPDSFRLQRYGLDTLQLDREGNTLSWLAGSCQMVSQRSSRKWDGGCGDPDEWYSRCLYLTRILIEVMGKAVMT